MGPDAVSSEIRDCSVTNVNGRRDRLSQKVSYNYSNEISFSVIRMDPPSLVLSSSSFIKRSIDLLFKMNQQVKIYQ